MKKVLLFAVAVVACCTFSSCKKTCTCTEKNSGVSQEIDTDSQYRTCKDIQDLFKSTSAGMGHLGPASNVVHSHFVEFLSWSSTKFQL